MLLNAPRVLRTKRWLATVTMLIGFMPACFARVVAYTTPSLGPLSPDFTLVVSGVHVPVYSFQRNGDKPDYYFAHFSFGGKVLVSLTASQMISKISVSPIAFAIRAGVSGRTASFSLTDSRYLIVKVDSLTEVVIAADGLETDVPAAKGDGIFNVLTYGADKTGSSSSTGAFRAAIAAAAARTGGGTIYVPDGLYVTANLILQSHSTLYLSGNAVIQASKNASEFSQSFTVGSPGNHGTTPEKGTWFVSTAPDSTNITIRGRGVIDGSGSYLTDPAHGYLLDDLIVPLGTSNFLLDGIVGWDAGFWALTPDRSNHVRITNYKGMQSLETYQNDGIDIDEDQHVLVRHAIIVSRDDCYSTKTWGPNGLGKNWPGSPEAVSDVLFQDVIAWTTDGAFKVGQGDSQSQSDITVDHGYVYQAHWVVYLKPDLPKSADAAPVSNVTFRNIDVEASPRTHDGKPFTWLYIELPFASLTNLTMENITVRTQVNAAQISTADHGSIKDIVFKHVEIGGKKVSSFTDLGVDVTGVNLTGASFNGLTNP